MITPFKQYKAIIQQRARKLRNNPTIAETYLWKFLRKQQLKEVRFLRQKPIIFNPNGRVYFFIADFNCHKYKLIIEVDGCVHNEDTQKKHDEVRTGVLQTMGFIVLRFKNEEVLDDIETVIKKIKYYL
ncbi:MAG: DUF559 domain-containing protein [Candidatus Magasanikbacteria bacterium]|nr:DUF559 domain-containing protein [Candidatus Magasanikbacteria bacterium]